MYSICLSLTQHNAFKIVTNGVCCLFLFLLPVLCLHCCVWALATCSKWGLLSSCSTCASRCSGVSYGGHGLQGAWASVVAAHSLSSCGIWTLQSVAFSSGGPWAQQLWPAGLVALPHVESCGPGNRTCVPALAGRFLTTGPPRKSCSILFFTVAMPVYILTQSTQGFLFFTFLPTLIFYFFDDSILMGVK